MTTMLVFKHYTVTYVTAKTASLRVIPGYVCSRRIRLFCFISKFSCYCIWNILFNLL